MVRYLWTQAAVDCYERGCICKGCPIAEVIETKCQMKYVVIENVRIIGAPPRISKTTSISRE